MGHKFKIKSLSDLFNNELDSSGVRNIIMKIDAMASDIMSNITKKWYAEEITEEEWKSACSKVIDDARYLAASYQVYLPLELTDDAIKSVIDPFYVKASKKDVKEDSYW